MRRLIAFACVGETLVGTLDDAAEPVGVLVVGGGNEPRMGAHRGMALLAARLAAAGTPVLRFDRRGVGDSSGENNGYAAARDDISAACAEFRRSGVNRIIGFGNCDAATALALFGGEAGVDALVLANPWVIAPTDLLPPAAAIRSRYSERLRDPRAWWRLASGGVDFRKLIGGLGKLVAKPDEGELAATVAAALAAFPGPVTILLARGDNTAIAFRDAFARRRLTATIILSDTDSHSFAKPGDADWLFEQLVLAVARYSAT